MSIYYLIIPATPCPHNFSSRPNPHSLAQSVKLMVSMGVLLGYPLQFFVAIQVMWPGVKQMCGIQGRSLAGELLFRLLLVIVTRK